MKKGLIAALFAAALAVVACYNDDDIQKKVNDLDKRVSTLEYQVRELNEKTLPGIQATVAAIQDGVLVTSVTKTSEGYVILFSDGTTATLKDGEKGEKGDKGDQGDKGDKGDQGDKGDKGDQGDKGDEPAVGVTIIDGEYYWTINGEVLKDANGNPMKVYAQLPLFRINEGKWEMSTDNGQTWKEVESINPPTGSTISIVDGETSVTFYINGQAHVIQKELPFSIKFEISDRQNIGIPQGETFMFEYTLPGSQEGDEIEVGILNVMGTWEAKVLSLPTATASGYISVKNVDNTPCSVFVYAANGKGKTDIKSLVFEEGSLTAAVDVKKAEAAGGNFVLTVTTNMEYEVYIPSTAKWLTIDETKATRTEVIKLIAAANTTGAYRTAQVDVILQNGDTKEFVVYQEPCDTVATEIASIANLEAGTAVALRSEVVVASAAEGYVISDGKANLYIAGKTAAVGDVVDVTGTVTEDGFVAATSEVKSSNHELPAETRFYYYGYAQRYNCIFTAVNGTLAINDGKYSIVNMYGDVYALTTPASTEGLVAGQKASAKGYVIGFAEGDENDTYTVLPSDLKCAAWTESGEITHTVDGSKDNFVWTGAKEYCMYGLYYKSSLGEKTKDEFTYSVAYSNADDYQYDYLYSYGAYYTPEKLASMLLYVKDEVCGDEFDPGEYIVVAFGVDAYGRLDGTYGYTEFTVEAPSNVTIEVAVSDITHNSANAKFTPSSDSVYYLYSIESPGWVDQFETTADLAAADLNYWKSKYGETYSNYGFDSIEDLILTGLCKKGEYTYAADGLNPESKYYAYAFALDSQLNVISDVAITSFNTQAKPESNLQFYGTAIWHDVFVSTIFNMDGKNIDLDCDVYTDSNAPGKYYFDSPYWYDNIASWFDLEPENMKQYTANYKEVMLEIDCSDPTKVICPLQSLGVMMSSSYGIVSGGFSGGYTVDNYGVFDDATKTITFAADGSRKVLWSMTAYSNGGTKASTLANDFTVVITPGGSSIKPASVVPTSVKNGKSNRSSIALDAKVRPAEVPAVASSTKASQTSSNKSLSLRSSVSKAARTIE